ncbi:MAG: hypothetical protein ACR2N3_04755 [Pyrinomonadaceae bacterium]
MNKQEETQLLEYIIAPNYTDSLFSANHRNAMKAKYGYTNAESIKIDELNFQAYRPNENQDLIF